MKWIWKDYREKAITAPGNSKRVDEIIPFGSKWEKTDDFPKSTAVCKVLSVDWNMLYCGDRDLDELWKFPVDSDGKPEEKRYVHGYLHTLPGYCPRGALDMALDCYDRLYVLTAIGIQCVRSFGLIDAILSIPEGEEPVMIAIRENELYLKTERSVWKREIRRNGRGNEKGEVHYSDYYNN